MLEGDKIVPIPGSGTPNPEGLVNIPTQPDGTVTVTFPLPPDEITQIKVKPPPGTQPGDEVTVTVTFTDEDGSTTTEVSDIE